MNEMQTDTMSGAADYSDIIDLPRPACLRPRMPLRQRAAQFAPFAALGRTAPLPDDPD